MGSPISIFVSPGDRFGYWTVLRSFKETVKKGLIHRPRRMVEVQCVCGTKRVRTLYAVHGGYTKSCGCVRPVAHPHHSMFLAGARRKGDSIDDRYFGRLSVTNLFDDVGERPSLDHFLALVEPEKGVVPGNVVWCLGRQGNSLKGRTPIYKVKGEWMNQSYAARKLGVSQNAINGRRKAGWSPVCALVKPKTTTSTRLGGAARNALDMAAATEGGVTVAKFFEKNVTKATLDYLLEKRLLHKSSDRYFITATGRKSHVTGEC